MTGGFEPKDDVKVKAVGKRTGDVANVREVEQMLQNWNESGTSTRMAKGLGRGVEEEHTNRVGIAVCSGSEKADRNRTVGKQLPRGFVRVHHREQASWHSRQDQGLGQIRRKARGEAARASVAAGHCSSHRRSCLTGLGRMVGGTKDAGIARRVGVCRGE